MPLIAVAALAALVAEYWWVILFVVMITTAAVLIRRTVRARRHLDAIAAWLRAELAYRGDQQDAWLLAGDPRGVYGEYPPVELDSPGPSRGPVPRPAAQRARMSEDEQIRTERTRREVQRARARRGARVEELHQHGSDTAVQVFTAGADISVRVTY